MSKRTYDILLTIFFVLIIVLFVSLYLYNESRNDMVEKAESQGYTCEKNIFGFYKTCYHKDYLEETGYIPIDDWFVITNNSTNISEVY